MIETMTLGKIKPIYVKKSSKEKKRRFGLRRRIMLQQAGFTDPFAYSIKMSGVRLLPTVHAKSTLAFNHKEALVSIEKGPEQILDKLNQTIIDI